MKFPYALCNAWNGRAYEHSFFRYSVADLLFINTSEIDFVERNADLQQLLRRWQATVKGTQYSLPSIPG